MELPVVLHTINYNTLRYRDRDKRSDCAHDLKKIRYLLFYFVFFSSTNTNYNKV